jgi:hypothetical protein
MSAPQMERRKVERISIEKPARLRPNDWSVVNVNVVDVSTWGFRAAADIQLRPGAYLSIEVPGVGRCDAKVIWQQGREFGAQFLRAMPLDHCAWTRPAIEVTDQPEQDNALSPPRLAEFLAAYIDSRSAKRRSGGSRR